MLARAEAKADAGHDRYFVDRALRVAETRTVEGRAVSHHARTGANLLILV
jgi:hypothetical protein